MPNTTFNPGDVSSCTLSNASLTATNSVPSAIGGTRSVDKLIAGTCYIEYTLNSFGSNYSGVGFGSLFAPLANGFNNSASQNTGTVGLCQDGYVYVNGLRTGVYFSGVLVSGLVIGIAFNIDTGLIWFRIGAGGWWNNTASADPVAGIGGVHVQGLGRGFPLYAMAAVYGSGEQVTANFGNTAFAGAVPSGYTPGFGTGVAPPTNMAASQVALEQWSPITATQMRVTQIGVEQWGPIGHTNMTVTQVAVEQWGPVAVAPVTIQATWNADGISSAMWYGGMAPGAPPLPLPGASLNDGWVPHGSSDYLYAWNTLLPKGQAWNRDFGSVQQMLWAGLTDYWGDVDANAALLLTTESDPRKTLMLLPDWEHAWGLPDPCVTAPQTIYARRQALITKMTLLGCQSRQCLISYAAELGYTITISEYSPYMCGVSRVGDTIQQDVMAGGDGQHYRWELGPPEMRFIWTVHLSASPYTQFHCAIGQCGLDPEGRLLAFAVDTDLECILNRYKPAQTYIAFDYTGVSS